MASWKAPGPDTIHAYWYKVLEGLAECFRELVLDHPTKQITPWFVQGRTVLIPKEPGSTKPDKQHPITCLNTGYKLLTGTLTVILQSHVTRAGLLPLEQKVLRKGARGCMDALAIDTTVNTDVKRGKKSLTVAWVDFKKAYDQARHKWLRRCLRVLRAPTVVRKAIRQLIPSDLRVMGADGMVKIPKLFKRGLFQGDSLSPLQFCLAISPVSVMLREGQGHQSPHLRKVMHLFFMDDLKVYKEDSEEMESTLTLVDSASQAVGMEFGALKCRVAHIQRGRVIKKG